MNKNTFDWTISKQKRQPIIEHIDTANLNDAEFST